MLCQEKKLRLSEILNAGFHQAVLKSSNELLCLIAIGTVIRSFYSNVDEAKTAVCEAREKSRPSFQKSHPRIFV